MKIEAHVTAATDQGESLRIVAQGQAIKGYADRALRPWHRFEIDVPMNDRNKKAFFIGRHFDLVITPT